MANERTFLAWVRTGIGIMAFGFVVEKFSLFVRQLSFLLGRDAALPLHGYSPVPGIVLIGLGAVMGVLAFIRYLVVAKQIDDDTYRPSLLLSVLLALSFFAIGIFLVLSLIRTL
ncbi:MAG: DUF202 domain-containing protein [Thermodesulfovibrionales bacterium]